MTAQSERTWLNWAYMAHSVPAPRLSPQLGVDGNSSPTGGQTAMRRFDEHRPMPVSPMDIPTPLQQGAADAEFMESYWDGTEISEYSQAARISQRSAVGSRGDFSFMESEFEGVEESVHTALSHPRHTPAVKREWYAGYSEGEDRRGSTQHTSLRKGLAGVHAGDDEGEGVAGDRAGFEDELARKSVIAEKRLGTLRKQRIQEANEMEHLRRQRKREEEEVQSARLKRLGQSEGEGVLQRAAAMEGRDGGAAGEGLAVVAVGGVKRAGGKDLRRARGGGKGGTAMARFDEHGPMQTTPGMECTPIAAQAVEVSWVSDHELSDELEAAEAEAAAAAELKAAEVKAAVAVAELEARGREGRASGGGGATFAGRSATSSGAERIVPRLCESCNTLRVIKATKFGQLCKACFVERREQGWPDGKGGRGAGNTASKIPVDGGVPDCELSKEPARAKARAEAKAETKARQVAPVSSRIPAHTAPGPGTRNDDGGGSGRSIDAGARMNERRTWEVGGGGAATAARQTDGVVAEEGGTPQQWALIADDFKYD